MDIDKITMLQITKRKKSHPKQWIRDAQPANFGQEAMDY